MWLAPLLQNLFDFSRGRASLSRLVSPVGEEGGVSMEAIYHFPDLAPCLDKTGCPKCGSTSKLITKKPNLFTPRGFFEVYVYECSRCGHIIEYFTSKPA